MKNLFYSLLIVLIVQSCVFAQKVDTSKIKKAPEISFEDKTVKNEIGFDMFYFLNLFRNNFESPASSIFAVSYNRELSDKISLHTTLGSGYSNNVSIADSTPSLRVINVLENLKAGVAWEKELFKRCQFYYGADLEFQYGHGKEQQLTPFKNNTKDYISNIFMIGPGPFLGFVFYFNPRVSVNIESNLNFIYSINTTKTVDVDHPELNSKYTIKGITTTFMTPQNVFLNIRF